MQLPAILIGWHDQAARVDVREQSSEGAPFWSRGCGRERHGDSPPAHADATRRSE